MLAGGILFPVAYDETGFFPLYVPKRQITGKFAAYLSDTQYFNLAENAPCGIP
jgi:choline kinase